jgi:hypothetical protein
MLTLVTTRQKEYLPVWVTGIVLTISKNNYEYATKNNKYKQCFFTKIS